MTAAVANISALEFKEELKAAQQLVIAAFTENHKAEQLLHDLCRNVDNVLIKIWKNLTSRPAPRWSQLVVMGEENYSPILM